MTTPKRYALVEAGGTKCLLGLASGPDAVTATCRIPTTTPAETLAAVSEWISRQVQDGGPLDAIGIASFGPLQLDPSAPDWGHITATPKPHWRNADIVGPIAAGHDCPVGFDTDVNGAALAEYRWGAGQGQRALAYITIGTGIGGGAVVDGRLLRGLSHPEMGHIRVPRHPDDSGFAGHCPFHGDCLEGLASGPAIIARWGAPLSTLPADHPARAIIAWYLAQAVVTLQALMAPGRIILGGGVMATPDLLDGVRRAATVLGNGYFVGRADAVVVAPGLGDRAGLLGALALAMDAIS